MAWVPALFFFLWLEQANPAEEGRKALEANNYTVAAEQFQKVVDADPKDWTARFHLGLALSLLGKDEEAIAAYRKVLEEKPGLYEAELNLGILLLRQKQAAEAAKLLESAAIEKPKEYRPQYYLAEAQAASEAWKPAETAYRAALEIQPGSAEASVGLARALVKQEKLDEAAEHYRKAAETPEYHRALLELAHDYEVAKQPEKAIELYKQFPDDAGARERLGELLLEGGQAADAIPELEKAYADSPTPANRIALATAYLRTKQAEKALPLLEKATAEDPDNTSLRLYYGRALRDQRNFQAAAQQFFQVVQKKPDSVEAWNELAGMLILLENYPQALAALDRAQALGGAENPAYYYFRAIILDRVKNYEQALPAYEKFLELSKGLHPDEEFKARQRLRIIKRELGKR